MVLLLLVCETQPPYKSDSSGNACRMALTTQVVTLKFASATLLKNIGRNRPQICSSYLILQNQFVDSGVICFEMHVFQAQDEFPAIGCRRRVKSWSPCRLREKVFLRFLFLLPALSVGMEARFGRAVGRVTSAPGLCSMVLLRAKLLHLTHGLTQR